MTQPPLFETRETQHSTRYVPFRADGATYDHERDSERLGREYEAVWRVMSDGNWHTPPELEQRTGYPWASISARLRDMRKPRFGSHAVERRYVEAGLFEYRLLQAPSGPGANPGTASHPAGSEAVT